MLFKGFLSLLLQQWGFGVSDERVGARLLRVFQGPLLAQFPDLVDDRGLGQVRESLCRRLGVAGAHRAFGLLLELDHARH